MKKCIAIFSLFFVIILLINCTSYYRVLPKIELQDNNIGEKASVMISEKDLNLKVSTSFGLVGLIFPKGIKVGNTLVHFSKTYFNNYFTEVLINERDGEEYLISFYIEEFDLSSVQKVASLKLKIRVENILNNTKYEKSYNGKGSGHFPIYSNESSQRNHVRETTREAFQIVFDQITSDIIEFSKK